MLPVAAVFLPPRVEGGALLLKQFPMRAVDVKEPRVLDPKILAQVIDRFTGRQNRPHLQGAVQLLFSFCEDL